ncbi:MAG: bifunctional DNA-formamidopyrimidine glycosylase/DNA-(apurinic or apyrimidinic site) lyase [Pyrinomonadaceae bacterium]|nr:bifunctional DNA-formamidopyrimidine glycosylase/DNA-(apurinic or apyrimidinic site) lyase [Pyrinomonadaceae bacterium]
MPELPEVDLVARSLNSLVRGRTIVSAELLRERLAPDITAADFGSSLANARVEIVGRRGKHILFRLENDRTLIVHLRMSGRFALLTPEGELPRFTHAIFRLDDGSLLVFSDQRHFGLMKIVPTASLSAAKEIAKLAPEPFSEDFSVSYLRDMLARSSRTLKEFLLDQTKVCGLGNIYAAEAMFAAGIHPAVSANLVGRIRARRLHESILAVLDEAIRHNLGKPIDPENLEGSYFSGSLKAGWYVYDREGEPCAVCGSPIVRLKQGGRSTYYCRKCQRK